MSPQRIPGNPTAPLGHVIVNAFRRYAARKHVVLVAIGVILLTGLSHAVQAEDCANCDTRGVRVGVQGVLFTSGGGGDYVHINVDGNPIAIGVWVGSDPCNDIILTNQGFFYMKPGRTYLVDAGWFLCVTNINFEVPDGYELYIKTDASYGTGDTYHKATTIHRTNGGFAQTGDGAWEIVLREKCPSCGGDAGPGKSGESNGPQMGTLGSALWSVGLGELSDSRSAGSISIQETNLSALTFTPNVLIYTPPENTAEVEDIRVNNDGSVRSPTDQVIIDPTWNSPFGILRQVRTPESLVDIVTVSNSEFDVRYYSLADVGAKVGGLYAVTGQPFVTWKIKNPNPGTADHLRISKIQPSGTDDSDMAWDSIGGTWSITKGAGARVQTTSSIVSPIDENERTETTTVKDNNGQTASKMARTYYAFPWGEELTSEVLDPDGAALVTTYTYYDNSAEPGRYTRVKSVQHADGSWEGYDYDGMGNTILVVRPWKDETLQISEWSGRATKYTYTNNDGVTTLPFAKLVASVEEKIDGQRVGYQTISRASTTVNGQTAVTETQTDYVSATATQVTRTTSYYETAPALLANRVAFIDYPDGRRDSHNYEKGDYTTNADPALNAFTPNVNGAAERETIVHGTIASPNGIAFKTTEDVAIRDQFGNSVLNETYVYNGTGYERVGWTVSSYNVRGQPTQTTKSNNEVTISGWTGDQKTSVIDSSGVETAYTHDAMSRVKTSTKKGIAAGGGFPAQVDIVTTYQYDSMGRTSSTVISAGGLSSTISANYDIAGRLLTETDAAGLVKSHSYANGGRTHTITFPGGATRIIENYLDGKLKTQTGTADVSHSYDYVVNQDGTQVTHDFIGVLGLGSPRWVKTTKDWLGRMIKEEKPSFTGVSARKLVTYNNAGQLQRERLSYGVGTVRLRADKLYEYDELGNQMRAGLDVDGNGLLSPASADRFSETNEIYEKTGTDWFGKTTSLTYTKDNDAAAVSTIQKMRLNNFQVVGTVRTISDTIIIDVAGNSTESTFTVDPSSKKRTTTSIAPDSTTPAVTISINNLVQSSSPTRPQSPITYAYDALGRPITITDPRTGVSTKSYSATTSQLVSASDGSNTLTYEYYSNADANAGRLKSQTNAAGKKVYFAYNSRGELLQTWGDTTHPVELVYDSYGQRTEMHTFRGGSGWAATTWPTATTGAADVTTWIYQDSTGLLTQKRDANNQGPTFTYDLPGRLLTRKWARTSGSIPITTTYAYDVSTGDQTVIGYSDGTPQVTKSYDRVGRPRSVTDATGVRALAYNQGGDFQSETISGGLLDGISVNLSYDTFLRRNSLQATRGGTTYLSQTYGYDTASRLSTVTSNAQTATYAYYPTSGLLNTTTFTGGTNIARSYDSFGRLQSITTTPAADPATNYAYTYNNLNQRTRATREEGSYWSYAYNDRGELIFGKKYWLDNSPVVAQQNEYIFDNLGNRVSTLAGGDAAGANLRSATYTTNSLNQYSQRTVPGAVDIIGSATATASVTVNGQSAYRRGEYFAQTLTLSNVSSPVHAQANVTGVKTGAGPGGQDVVTNQSGNFYLPKTPELFTYDLDGNLTSDGRWTYTWDAENRLMSMTALSSLPNGAKKKLEFAYDWMGRRVQKRVYGWNAVTASYQPQSTTKFVYSEWDLVAETDGAGVLLRNYTWGLDDSGTLNGAGGIGGLLTISESGNTYQVGYDGNGNVVALADASTGKVAGAYEYDAFGNRLRVTGDYASRNPFGFSTKYTDGESSLVYFGYRYYQPQTGRWFGRDPIEEEGGINLYAYVKNNPVSLTDFLGLYEIDVHYYLTYYLALKLNCFKGIQEWRAHDIANEDQKTDEDPTTSPAYGSTEQQRAQNRFYHALSPNAQPGVGNNALWLGAMREKDGEHVWIGRYLHYLQDTFSHATYTSDVYGHASGTHLVDKTASDPGKARTMALATFKALVEYAKAKKCKCDPKWDNSWNGVLDGFNKIETDDPRKSTIDATERSWDNPGLGDPVALMKKRRALGLKDRYSDEW